MRVSIENLMDVYTCGGECSPQRPKRFIKCLSYYIVIKYISIKVWTVWTYNKMRSSTRAYGAGERGRKEVETFNVLYAVNKTVSSSESCTAHFYTPRSTVRSDDYVAIEVNKLSNNHSNISIWTKFVKFLLVGSYNGVWWNNNITFSLSIKIIWNNKNLYSWYLCTQHRCCRKMS